MALPSRAVGGFARDVAAPGAAVQKDQGVPATRAVRREPLGQLRGIWTPAPWRPGGVGGPPCLPSAAGQIPAPLGGEFRLELSGPRPVPPRALLPGRPPPPGLRTLA